MILLATDGVPTDNQGHRDIRSFEYVLKHERKPTNRIPVTIIACTGIRKKKFLKFKKMNFVELY